MQPNLDAYDSLDKALDEKRYWMQVMHLWKVCQDTIGESLRERVTAFTFRDKFLGIEQTAENRKARTRWKPPVYSGRTHHNCVRLDDDSILEIPLMPRPEPPGHMKVNLKVTL